MSDDLAASPPASPGGGFRQPSSGTAPVPVGASAPAPPAAGYPVSAYPAPGHPASDYPVSGYPVSGYPGPGHPGVVTAPPQTPERSRTLGVVSLVLAIAAVVGSIALSAITGFAAASGAMHHAVGMSPDGLENLTEQQLLALLSPVRGLVLWAEIGWWAGTVLGIAALALGITAIATRRGRGLGIAAVVIAAAGPIVYALVVGVFVIAGIAAGAS
ncbi:hypothetical protein [Microbacterium lacticum]